MSLLSSLASKTIQDIEIPQRPDSDAELLARFLNEKSENAFSQIVARYGEMVFAVAMRAVRHRQTAEDVTQATFLVLARDAKKIAKSSALGSWLHGVTIRLAKKALKRCHREFCNSEKVNDVVTETDEAQEFFDENSLCLRAASFRRGN